MITLAGTSVGTLNEILATRVKMEFQHRVDFAKYPYEEFHRAKQWCKDNCKGIWNIESTHALYFQFDNDTDAMMFMLKWSGKGEMK